MKLFRLFAAIFIALGSIPSLVWAHSLPNDEWMIMLAKLSVNRLPDTLNELCDANDQSIRTRVEALTPFLARKLTAGDICENFCVNKPRNEREVNEMSKEEIVALMAEYKSKSVQKNGKQCSKTLLLLEKIKLRDGRSLAELVMVKNGKIPKTIHNKIDVIASQGWTGNQHGQAWGEAQGSVIRIEISFEPYYISSLAGEPIPTQIGSYDFSLTYFRESKDANPKPIDINIAKLTLKVNGQTYLPKSPMDRKELDDGCSCGKFYSKVQFNRAGPIGKEPFEIIVSGISDADTKFPPLVFRSKGVPAGLIGVNLVLQEIISAQWTRD